MKILLNSIKKPYPFIHSSIRINFLRSILFGAIFTWLTYHLENEITLKYLKISKTELAIFAGLIIVLSYNIVFEYVRHSPSFLSHRNHWTIMKEIKAISVLLMLNLVMAFALLSLVVMKDTRIVLSFRYFVQMAFSNLIYVLVFFSIHLWFNYTVHLKNNLIKLKKHYQQLKQKLKPQNAYLVTIPTEIQNETIHLDITQLLFIKSEGNYVEIYTEKDDKILKRIFRVTIKNIEEALSEIPYIFRTHRSYLVNTRKIQTTEGGARNYLLLFKGISFKVPVARSKFKEFNQQYRSL